MFGAGLLGLLTVQLMRASGCEVLTVELNADRLALAEKYGPQMVNVGSGDDPEGADRLVVSCPPSFLHRGFLDGYARFLFCMLRLGHD